MKNWGPEHMRKRELLDSTASRTTEPGRQPSSNQRLIDLLRNCPEKNYFVRIPSEDTNTIKSPFYVS